MILARANSLLRQALHAHTRATCTTQKTIKRGQFREMSSVKIVSIPGEDGQKVDYPELDGILLAPIYIQIGLEERMAAIRNYPHEPGDIFVCSYPKSGTHWLCNMIEVLRFCGPVDEAPSGNVPFIDLFLKQPSNPDGRLLHSHMQYKYLPNRHKQQGGKIVLVVRNPKDVAVSYFHHLRKMRDMNFTQSWDQYVQHFLTGKVMYGSYFDYLNSWQTVIQERTDLKLHIVYYEHLQRSGFQELKRLQQFLGYNHPDERLRQVLSRCDINRLRSDVDDKKVRTLLKDKHGKGFLYRKGEIGDWQNHLSVAQNMAFDKTIAEKLSGSMFHFTLLPTAKHKL